MTFIERRRRVPRSIVMMTLARPAPLLLAALLTLFAGRAMPAQSRPPIVPSVDLRVLAAPATFVQAGQRQLVYELQVTNFQPVEVELVDVRVEAPGRQPVAVYRDQDLARRIVRPGLPHSHAAPRLLSPGLTAVVNFWIQMPDGAMPASITHAIDVRVLRQPPQEATIEGGEAAVSTQAAVTLGPPLEGGPWAALYDPLLKGGHRTAIYAVGGQARIPGRFAIDWVRLPADGVMPPAPKGRPDDRNGFGAPVLAVADAVVAAAVDDTVDQTPPPIPPEKASGNYVSLDLGGGRFAFYEHLKQGSVVVRPGDRVKRGQVIAQLGSSGSSSTGPHLHFHVADANSLLGAEGVPFVFERFEHLGAFTSIEAPGQGQRYVDARPALEQNARPSPNAVVRFP
jgi:murein DD-endopeptidase